MTRSNYVCQPLARFTAIDGALPCLTRLRKQGALGFEMAEALHATLGQLRRSEETVNSMPLLVSNVVMLSEPADLAA